MIFFVRIYKSIYQWWKNLKWHILITDALIKNDMDEPIQNNISLNQLEKGNIILRKVRLITIYQTALNFLLESTLIQKVKRDW